MANDKKKQQSKKEKTTLYLTLENKQNLRIAYALSGRSFSDMVNEFLDKPLKELITKLQEEKQMEIVKTKKEE